MTRHPGITTRIVPAGDDAIGRAALTTAAPTRRVRVRRAVAAALAGMLLSVAIPGAAVADPLADDGGAASGDERRWELDVLPYVWIPGNFGTITARGHTSHVDVTVKDALDLATGGDAFTAAGYFELRYDRWFAYVDGFGGYADERVTETAPSRQFPRLTLGIDAKLKIKPVLMDFGFGYRLGEWALPNRRRPVTLGLSVGTRYYWFYQRLRASATVSGPRSGIARAADVTKTFDWADPLIGLRWEVPVLDCASLEMRSDIGGFGAGSDLSWNIAGGVRWWPDVTILSSHPFVAAGYRAVGIDRGSHADDGVDLQFRGPYGGIGAAF